MGSLSEDAKGRSPLANMALATQAWKEKQQRPLIISKRMMTTHARQEEEMKNLGFEESYRRMEHVNMGLPSSLGNENASLLANLGNIFPQLPSSHLKTHLSSANGELDQAVDSIMLETQTQDNLSNTSPDQDPVSNNPSNEDILIQMFPQYHRAGISCALQSCGNNLYDTVDLLLKLLHEESRRSSDTPGSISFSQSASIAVDNIPLAPLNPFAMALASPTTSPGMRKANFCKRCGQQLPDSFTGALCPNPSCSYPFQPNLRM